MSFNEAAMDALVNAVWDIKDPAARFSAAVSAALAGVAGEVNLQAERRRDGTLLRLSNGGRPVEVVLNAAEARSLAGYLTGRS